MKRTEMILKIMEMLVELPEDLEAAATSLLTRIERAGMEPPPHQERRGTGYADEYGMEESHDEWVQGWEEE